jgi:hypothetical protein
MTHPLHDIELPKGHADHFPIVIEVPMGVTRPPSA